MSSPPRSGGPHWPGQHAPHQPTPPPRAQHPQHAGLGGYPQQTRKPRSKALLWSAAGGALAVAIVVALVVLLLGKPRGEGPSQLDVNAAAGRRADPPARPDQPQPGRPDLLGKSPEALLALMPTAGDFPKNIDVQSFIDQPGEANDDERLAPLPPEATNPPGCWTHLEIRKNRDDIPDITRIATTRAQNDSNVTIAAAQIAKEDNGADALAQAKSWLGRCQEFDYVHHLKAGQPPIHFKIVPLPQPPGFSDPFFGAKFTESGPTGPRGYRYFFAARVRGLLVLSEGVCDLASCDEGQNLRISQQIPIMFSKIVQGLRNAQ